MTTYKYFLLEVQDGIAVFTVNRPEALNAMNNACWQELYDFMAWAQTEPSIRVIVFTGAGEKAFVAGADIKEINGMTPLEAFDTVGLKASRLIENGSKPTIAAVNGFAFGGGCELAVSCDIRLASENAVFGLPETSLGIIPGLGGTQRITKLVGMGLAKEMVLAGRNLKGPEAAAAGLVMKCVPAAQLMDEAKAVAKKIMERGPLATTFAKKILNLSAHTDVDTGLLVENLGFTALMSTADMKEGTAAFMEKRSAEYKGK